MWLYAWHDGGFLDKWPPEFKNLVEFCFGMRTGLENCCFYNHPEFIQCAWCKRLLCFNYFWIEICKFDHLCNRFLALPIFFHSLCKKTVFLHAKNLYIARAKILFFVTRWYTLFCYSRLAFSVVAVILVGLRTICWTTRTSQTGSPKQRGKAASLKIRKQRAWPRCSKKQKAEERKPHEKLHKKEKMESKKWEEQPFFTGVWTRSHLCNLRLKF